MSVLPPVVRSDDTKPSPQLVAMIHVHTNSIILNPSYRESVFQLPSMRSEDLRRLATFVTKCHHLWVKDIHPNYPFLGMSSKQCRTSVFLLHRDALLPDLFEVCSNIPAVEYLAARALQEASTYVRHGIDILEIENVGAPYFMGRSGTPWEELIMLLYVSLRVREHYPGCVLGVHLLSCNEVEALPIALLCGAYFMRAESALFQGTRPEGITRNDSTLAHLMYLRHVMRLMLCNDAENTDQCKQSNDDRAYPIIWVDMLKKHTAFAAELQDLQSTWLPNVLFCKLEGVIITGIHTGSDVSEGDLVQARHAIDKTVECCAKIHKECGTCREDINVEKVRLKIPLITGSGTNLEMYAKYADYLIVGTLFKKGCYWENPVDEACVLQVVQRIQKAREAKLVHNSI